MSWREEAAGIRNPRAILPGKHPGASRALLASSEGRGGGSMSHPGMELRARGWDIHTRVPTDRAGMGSASCWDWPWHPLAPLENPQSPGNIHVPTAGTGKGAASPDGTRWPLRLPPAPPGGICLWIIPAGSSGKPQRSQMCLAAYPWRCQRSPGTGGNVGMRKRFRVSSSAPN